MRVCILRSFWLTAVAFAMGDCRTEQSAAVQSVALNQWRFLTRQLAKEVNMTLHNPHEAPFQNGFPLPSESVPEFARQHQDFMGHLHETLVIDGIQVFTESFVVNHVSDSIQFARYKTRDCAPYMKKTGFDARFHEGSVPIPCIYIGKQADSNVIVAGFPPVPFLPSDEGPIFKTFYSSFFFEVLVPAINLRRSTKAYKRYSAMIDRVVTGRQREEDIEIPIHIHHNEWPVIAEAMDGYKTSFLDRFGWKLHLGLAQVGQNVYIGEHASLQDILTLTGLSMFLNDTHLQYINIHFAVDLYCLWEDTIMLPKRNEFAAAIGANQRGAKMQYYSTLGMGDYPSITLKKDRIGTLQKVKEMLLHKPDAGHAGQTIRNMQTIFQSNVELFDLDRCSSLMDDMTMQYFQTYFATTHTVYPRRYKPHQYSPAADMIMSGLNPAALYRLRQDYSLWKNLGSQILSGNIPLRVEFVLETKGPQTFHEPNPFACFEILMQSMQESVYGRVARPGFREPGYLAQFLINNMHVIPNFSRYLIPTISSMYAMLLCPLVDAYAFHRDSDAEVTSMYDIEGVLTTHLAENLLLYMFDGTIAYQKDYPLLSKYYQVRQDTQLQVHKIHLTQGKCGGIINQHFGSDKIVDQLPEGYYPYLAAYKHPASFQRFFLIRQLSLTRGALNVESTALTTLYLDSCIVALRHFEYPLLPTVNTNYNNWLTFEHYKQFHDELPANSLTLPVLKEFLLSPVFFDALDVVGISFVRAAADDENLRTDASKRYINACKRNIKKNLLGVLSQYIGQGKLQIFYKITDGDNVMLRQSEDGMGALKTISRLAHAKVSCGAAALFDESLEGGMPLRLQFSLPASITNEIITDVFLIMQNELKIRKGQLEKLDFQQHPVLPVIFRIWYADPPVAGMNTYKKFLQSCAYILGYILPQFRDRNRISVIYASPYLQAFCNNRKLTIKEALKRLGLSLTDYTILRVPSHEQITDVYRYWFGRTEALEHTPADGDQLRARKLRNRFHYSICDATVLNVNSVSAGRLTFSNYLTPNGHPYVPNIYFFWEAQNHEHLRDQHHAYVMVVHPQFNETRWTVSQEISSQPKFLPIFMDPDSDSIINKTLHENIPFAGWHSRNGNWYNEINELMIPQDKCTKVLRADILNYAEHARQVGAPAHVEEMMRVEYDEAAENAIRAWREQRYLNNQQDQSVQPASPVLPESEPTYDGFENIFQEPDNYEHDASYVPEQLECPSSPTLEPMEDEPDSYFPVNEAVIDASNVVDPSRKKALKRKWTHRVKPTSKRRRISIANLKKGSRKRPHEGDEGQDSPSFIAGQEAEFDGITCFVERDRISCPDISITSDLIAPATTATQASCSVIKTMQVDMGSYIDVAIMANGSAYSYRSPAQSTRRQGSFEACSIRSRGLTYKAILCRKATVTVERGRAPTVQQCAPSDFGNNRQADSTRSVTTTMGISPAMVTTTTQPVQQHGTSGLQEKVRIELSQVSARDWYVIRMPGDGDCFFHSLHVMLRGSAKPRADGIIQAEKVDVQKIRGHLINAVSSAPAQIAESAESMTQAGINRNLYGIINDTTPHDALLADLVHSLNNDWGEDRALRLVTYFTGFDCDILFATTSRQTLDWGKVKWKGPVYRRGTFMDYCPAQALGPPFALLHEQAYEEGALRGAHWNLLVLFDQYQKFVDQSINRYSVDQVESEILRHNPTRYDFGVRLDKYLQSYFEQLDRISRTFNITNSPPPNITQGHRWT